MSAPSFEHVCSRCNRIGHVSDRDFSDWEITDELGSVVVCGGCLTAEEEQVNVTQDYFASAARMGLTDEIEPS